IISAHPHTSSYTLDVPEDSHIHPTFHVSQLKMHIPNDDALFPGRSRAEPEPIITESGSQEWFIDKILDRRKCGRGWQYKVRWKDEDARADRWLPGSEVEDCEALDHFLR
ncbi:hypothetical protein CONPUDRAFT_30657, partial [Coniophora puteana RWD-64-598 SS2]